MRRLTKYLVAAALLGVLAQPAAGDAPLAYYRFDPRTTADSPPIAGWLGHLLRFLQAAGAVPADSRAVADGVLIATVLSSQPHDVTLLDLRAHRWVPREVTVSKLQLVLSAETPDGPAAYHEVLRNVLSHYGQPGERTQEAITLPGGRVAARYRFASWEDWLALEWADDGKRFYLGVGAGALENWFSEDRSEPATLAAHREATGRADRPPVFELFADLAALRGAMPSLFDTGRTGPLLDLFEVGDADALMLHARRIDTFMVIDLTTAAQETIAHTPVTLDYWPAATGIPKPPAGFHLVAPVSMPKLTEQAMRAVWLAHEPEDRAGVDEEYTDHARQTGVSPTDFAGQFAGYLLVSDYPPSWLPIPGAGTVYLSVDPRADAERVRESFTRMMRPLLKLTPGGDEVGVAYDADRDVYWLDSPMRELFKSPAWGWAKAGDRAVMIGSYSPRAVLANRDWLNHAPKP